MTDRKAPWDKPNPRKHAGATGKHLTPAQLEEAKTRAAKAGRRYPNLVDNMAVASGQAGKTSKKTVAKKAKKKVKALGGRAGARQKTEARRAAKKKKTARRRKK